MIQIEARHLIHCDEDTFWELFFSPEVNAQIYSDVLKFPSFEVLEQREDERAMVRKASVQPRIHALPGAIQSMLGPNFRYIEDSVFDKATRRWSFTMAPSLLGDRLHNAGALRVEPSGPGQVTRVASATIEVRIFGFGKMVEGMMEKEMRAGWDDSAAFLNRWIAEHPAQAAAS
ncbi:DUF2505 family protein [Sorangium cellulosum]|uniref:DUF2505 domain-containing protein n=1 Tax=Sorangium cellulosum TaxID=56 RepID=A0A150Q947_SORCE|nr:DUF2505 family protein [Sorangium cellulosum]KYF64158.1 hypothetical protein BE15_31625 [Sorangium cellulosum]